MEREFGRGWIWAIKMIAPPLGTVQLKPFLQRGTHHSESEGYLRRRSAMRMPSAAAEMMPPA